MAIRADSHPAVDNPSANLDKTIGQNESLQHVRHGHPLPLQVDVKISRSPGQGISHSVPVTNSGRDPSPVCEACLACE